MLEENIVAIYKRGEKQNEFYIYTHHPLFQDTVCISCNQEDLICRRAGLDNRNGRKAQSIGPAYKLSLNGPYEAGHYQIDEELSDQDKIVIHCIK